MLMYVFSYNQLPSEQSQPQTEEADLQSLARILASHSAHELFSIHLLHRHGLSLHTGEVMVTSPAPHDTDASGPRAIYLKRRRVNAHESSHLFGRVYAFPQKSNVVTCEMQDTAPLLSKGGENPSCI